MRQQRLELRQQRAAKTGRSSDLRKVFHGNSHDDILSSTREALRSRLHYWAREIPIFVEQGGEVDSAVSEIPVNMSVIRATIGPGESSAWAGKSLDSWKGLEPLTLERERRRERIERLATVKRKAGSSSRGGGPGSGGRPSAGGAGARERQHRLYDADGGTQRG
ncbi:unnamed protein product, partial [Scytosiphon promiscuus]